MNPLKRDSLNKLARLLSGINWESDCGDPSEIDLQSYIFSDQIQRQEVLDIYNKRLRSSLNRDRENRVIWKGSERLLASLENNHFTKVIIHEFVINGGRAIAFTDADISELIGLLRREHT
jgi:hypothetical protein